MSIIINAFYAVLTLLAAWHIGLGDGLGIALLVMGILQSFSVLVAIVKGAWEAL